MLKIDQLSHWEKDTYFESIDFIVIGAGIVGYSCALEIKKNNPQAKVLVLERGYLPTGASSKNAGFACFGSATELMDDLSHIPEADVWDTVAMRWEGLQNLKALVGVENLELQVNGSWDLITSNETEQARQTMEKLSYLNDKSFEITGKKNIYSVDHEVGNTFGFQGVNTSFYNRLEGQINTGKMISRFHQLAIAAGVHCLFGIRVDGIETSDSDVLLDTSIGMLKASKVSICTNGFARQFLTNEDVLPARAQVLVTKPITNLKLKGTFHYQQGYYYFRNIGNRILLGGGRNLDFEGETTTDMGQSELIQKALHQLLSEVIIPQTAYEIESTWSGIMGVGATKKPIVQLIHPHLSVGVRMGGMGVAIGSLVGKEVAGLAVK